MAMSEFEGITPRKGDRQVSCSIASRPGKEFSIEYSRNSSYGPPEMELLVELFFDGEYSGGWVAPHPPARGRQTETILGHKQDNKLHPFIFIDPEIIEGETPSSIDTDHIGEIWVQLELVTASECIRMEGGHRDVGPSSSRVNEKDKRPGAVCVSLKESSEECAEDMILSVPDNDNPLTFVFRCRTEEWFQAKEIMRKPRHRSEQEPAEDPEVTTLLKPEPVEEAIFVITPERPRKIARRSGSFTIDGEIHQSTATGACSIPQSPAKGCPGFKVKVEEENSVSKIKEEGREVEFTELTELKAKQEELDEQISEFERKRANILEKIATLQAPRVGSETRSPRSKTKTERESTRLPSTPEVIDLTD